MIGKYIAALAFSSMAMSSAYCGDIGDAATAASKLTSVQGNVAVGVNTGNAKIKSEATARDSVANAGLAVIDSKSGSGKSVNLAVGVNTSEAEIAAKSSGGTANAGLAVIRNQ
jgi:hypothetical protein